MKGSEIDDPGHLIGLKPRRFPNWGARQQPIKICPLCWICSKRTGTAQIFPTCKNLTYATSTYASLTVFHF